MAMKYSTSLMGAILVLSLVLGTGCGSNPTLSQPGYKQALAVFNAVSRKDEVAISKLHDIITKSKSDSEVPASEADILLAVIENAKQGNWESATARMRKLLEKQAKDAPAASTSGEPRQRHRH